MAITFIGSGIVALLGDQYPFYHRIYNVYVPNTHKIALISNIPGYIYSLLKQPNSLLSSYCW